MSSVQCLLQQGGFTASSAASCVSKALLSKPGLACAVGGSSVFWAGRSSVLADAAPFVSGSPEAVYSEQPATDQVRHGGGFASSISLSSLCY